MKNALRITYRPYLLDLNKRFQKVTTLTFTDLHRQNPLLAIMKSHSTHLAVSPAFKKPIYRCLFWCKHIISGYYRDELIFFKILVLFI